jgi:hypothetical protein
MQRYGQQPQLRNPLYLGPKHFGRRIACVRTGAQARVVNHQTNQKQQRQLVAGVGDDAVTGGKRA